MMHINRQPYFIDRYNTYCAAGYLTQQSGADEMAKEISATQNYNYLSDISHPNLMKWIEASGLTFEELALIQPGYGGEWPATFTEMHYNNTGTDINEYIEVHQSKGIPGERLTSISFYNHLGQLYKSLQLNEMQGFFRNNSENQDSFYHYTFPINENFADSGKIELKNGSVLLSDFVYNSSGMLQTEYNRFGSPVQRRYSISESETTPADNSITYCGLYYSTWSPMILPATRGTLNACTKGALPITLSSFNYHLTNKAVQIKWQTASEANNDYFLLEKSSDGVNYKTIDKIKGAGTSNIPKNYSFTDNHPNFINYYRLKQVDLDNNYSYSKILTVRVPNANPFKIIQNFVTTNLQLQINLEQSNIGTIILYDISGREILKNKGKSGPQNINVSGLRRGKYFIRLTTNDRQVYSAQFVKE